MFAGLDADFVDQWKVLVYDASCRDIISPLMNVGALRQKGVTLHLLIASEREAISDAPAVYFVRPTEENIDRISDDCAKRLYRSFYIHFASRIERPLLEKLARNLVASNSVGLVAKIYDEYLDVVALEPSLFSLNIKNSFVAYNDPGLDEASIRLFISSMCTGLMSTFRIMGTLPVIRASPSGPAQMLAQELCASLRENISPRGPAQAVFAECLVSDRPRPLLIIMDRTDDMVPPLLHTSTYHALIDDLLDCKLNRVSVEVPSKDGGVPKKKFYDLNTQADNFLYRYAAAAFPDVVEANEKELSEVSARENEVRARPSNAAHEAWQGEAGTGGRDLKDAIDSLPELMARKANLEAHTNILQAVMKAIVARDIPTYFEVRSNIFMLLILYVMSVQQLEQTIVSTGRLVDKAAVVGQYLIC
jgi:hypothetical protein